MEGNGSNGSHGSSYTMCSDVIWLADYDTRAVHYSNPEIAALLARLEGDHQGRNR